ncbi:hypothetical protein HZS_6329 [Henneguya salminicola]|nr:hypothetical protein HZS_6329 [Henneguya salminicola]
MSVSELQEIGLNENNLKHTGEYIPKRQIWDSMCFPLFNKIFEINKRTLNNGIINSKKESYQSRIKYQIILNDPTNIEIQVPLIRQHYNPFSFCNYPKTDLFHCSVKKDKNEETYKILRKPRKNLNPSKSYSKRDIERKRNITMIFNCEFLIEDNEINPKIKPIVTFNKIKESKVKRLEFSMRKTRLEIEYCFYLSAQIFIKRYKCNSCETLITPLWRHTLEGIALCNACGIRFRKYQLKCNNCHYVPTKYEHGLIFCPACTKGTIIKSKSQ